MAGAQVMKRIPLIKFPRRHPKPSASSSQSEAAYKDGDAHKNLFSSTKLPTVPANTAVGGKASLQPKRTPVSDEEITAVLLGGCF